MIQDIVQVLEDLVQDDGQTLEQRDGPEALSVAQDMRDLLAARLPEESPFASLWEQFESDPEGTEAELIGTLEALAEADPALVERLNAYLEDYRWATTPLEIRQARLAQPASEDEDDLADDMVVVEGLVIAGEEDLADEPDEGYSEEGEYLYGNVPPTMMPEASVIRDGERLADEYELTEGLGVHGFAVAELFEELIITIEVHPDLVPSVKASLNVKLQAIHVQLDRGENVDEDAIIRHVRAMQNLDPGVAALALAELGALAGSFGVVMREVARRVRREDGDAGP
ncbi:MAG: hypothetical protein KKA73_22455 [Chloroflexi bacterium]|nr:hypothetical protein [Chloroflexota bacterium]MBU1750456.1 hypothetical protein [Chloroflexota bacterium]